MQAQFKPQFEGYKERVIDSFNRQALMKTINASILSIRPGEVELECPFHKNLTQQNGFIHAGIVSTLLDNAGGYAAFSLMPENAAVLTIEFKVNLLSPAKGEKFLAIGKVIKPGKNITAAGAKLYAHSNDNQKLVATMVGTMMAVYDLENSQN
ncbi:PaaI family thioesterase [Pseudomonadota bacterium]